MMRLLITFARYIAAIFVAFVVSMVVFFLLIGVMSFIADLGFSGAAELFDWCVWYMVFIAMGFSGVFTGSLCLERASRRVGSIILLGLGLAYCIWFQGYMNSLTMENGGNSYSWPMEFVPLALGGLGAVILFFRRRPSSA